MNLASATPRAGDRPEGLAPLPPLSALQPADDGGHRRLQRGSGAQDQPASLTHVAVQHVQIRAPNREIIEQRHQEMQRHSCMRHGLRQHECPGAGHHGGRSGSENAVIEFCSDPPFHTRRGPG